MGESEEAAAVYEKIAREYAALFDNDPSDDDFLKGFAERLHARARILDLGCGTGRHAGWLSRREFQVTGLDLSQGMLAIAKANYPAVRFLKGDMRTYGFAHPFEGVLLAYSLFHMSKDDARAVLERAKSLLTRGGLLLLIVQEGSGSIVADEPLLPGEQIFLQLYTEQEAREMLSSSGFAVLSVERKPPAQEGELPYPKLALLARRK